jgi:hypothetical protein
MVRQPPLFHKALPGIITASVLHLLHHSAALYRLPVPRLPVHRVVDLHSVVEAAAAVAAEEGVVDGEEDAGKYSMNRCKK